MKLVGEEIGRVESFMKRFKVLTYPLIPPYPHAIAFTFDLAPGFSLPLPLPLLAYYRSCSMIEYGW